MKNLLKLFAITILLSGAIATKLNAEEPQSEEYKMPGMMKLPTLIDCGPYDEILAIVQGKYGEEPFAIFEAFVQIPNGQVITGPSALYVNRQTGTWSVVVEIQSSGLCIVQMGRNFGPASMPGTKTSL